MSSRRVALFSSTLVTVLALSCGSTTDGALGPETVNGSGGGTGASGARSSGGASSIGGALGSGGMSSLGGASGSGAVPAAGTTSASAGGASGAAGATASVGGNGGAAGTGTLTDGGAAGTRAFKGVANSPCAARKLLGVSWYYNWEQKETEACAAGSGGGEFVPMVWGHTGAEQSAAGIKSAVSSFVSKGYGYVLGFNEPDNTGQSNLSVATAISLLPSFDLPSILVGTPASQANASGQTWFKDYMGQLGASTALRADFIAIHWYGWNAGSCDAKASQLESYIKYAEGFPGNRPIWLTEWGCLNQSAPTAKGVVDFYQGAVAVFARHPRLARYAWYPWSTNCGLNNADGTLTELGVAYAAAPANR